MTETREQKVDKILDYVDDLFRSGQFKIYDQQLRGLDVAELSDDEIITHLTISARAKDNLPSRQDFYNRARQELVNRRRRTSDLLKGLD